jgi:hypothetical protein
VGKGLDKCPSHKTLDAMISEKISLSSAHVRQKLQGERNTTMTSDETNIFGKTYRSLYYLFDHRRRHECKLFKVKKSSRTTLETFKEFLSEIPDVCFGNEDNVVDRIVGNLIERMEAYKTGQIPCSETQDI